MAKNTNEVADVQGLATNEIEFEEIKDAWKELLERAYEDSVQDIVNELDDGMLFDPSTVRQYVDEAEAAQDLYNMIDELVWEHNRRSVLECLQAPETCPVDNYTTHAEISDYEAIMAVKIVL